MKVVANNTKKAVVVDRKLSKYIQLGPPDNKKKVFRPKDIIKHPKYPNNNVFIDPKMKHLEKMTWFSARLRGHPYDLTRLRVPGLCWQPRPVLNLLGCTMRGIPMPH